MANISENLSTPVLGEYNVIVAGGGVGGVCAAVSAKRSGAQRVLILEKSVQFGGLATIGLISWYEPICDGHGKKIMYGMADELMQMALQYGPDSLPEEWRNNPDSVDTKKRFSAHFSQSMFAMALDEYIKDHGVDVLLDTQVVRPLMKGNVCDGLVVENKTGRGYYKCKMVIDATGDADILARAGVPCVCGENYLTYVAYMADTDTANKAAQTQDMIHLRRWVKAGSDLWGKGHPEGKPKLSGVTAEEVTQYVLEGRSMLFDKLRKDPPKKRDVTVLPSMAQFRTTRRIDGDYTLTEADEGKHFKDSIAVAVDFYNRGKLYELPYRTLVHSGFDNLFTVGRSISSAGWAWDVTRVIPVAAATGQAAGTAAAMCATGGVTTKQLKVEGLQRRLGEAGARLRID